MKLNFDNDTLLHIDIQADDKFEILNCVRESFEYMPGWIVDSLLTIAHPEARFYSFNLTVKKFYWWRSNDTLSDTQDADEVPIRDLADISNVLEFVYLNAESLREKPIIKGKFGFSYGEPYSPYYPKWEDPDLSSDTPNYGAMAKLFAKKQAAIKAMNEANDISQWLYDDYIKRIEWSQSQSELMNIQKKTLGFHGPKADSLRKYISLRIDVLKKEAFKIKHSIAAIKNNPNIDDFYKDYWKDFDAKDFDLKDAVEGAAFPFVKFSEP